MTRLNEVSPPGWGHTKAEKEKTKPNKPKSKIGGTAHAMKLAQKRGDIPKNMNIFALMWSMKNKGDKPHYKPGVKGKLKGKYKGPEGQNEMIDPKKIRNYKNVPNSVVAKADKEAQKVKDKEQKGTLEFPQMPQENMSLAPKGKGKKAAKALYKEEDIDMPSLVSQAINELTPEQKKKREASRSHSTLGKGRRLHGGRGADHPKGPMISSRGKFTYDRPAGTKRKPGREKIIATPVKKEGLDTWHPDPEKDRKSTSMKHTVKAVKHHDSRQAAKKVQDILKKQRERNAQKEEVENEVYKPNYGRKPWHPSQAKNKPTDYVTGPHNYPVNGAKKKKPAPPKKEGIEGDALVKAVANSPKQQALKKKQMLSITPAGKKAVKKGDQKLSITPKGLAAVKELDYKKFGFETQDDLIEYAVSYYEGAPTPKFKPLKHKVWGADASIPAGARPKSPGKIKKYKASGAMPEAAGAKELEARNAAKSNKKRQGAPSLKHKVWPASASEETHFGNKLRQAIEEAKKASAIDTINKIVKTKTMGKLHGQKVDLFTASAIQQVYNALNKQNQQKMETMMSKDVHGLLKMAKFSMTRK